MISLFSALSLFCLLSPILSLPPPAGVVMKPSKEVGETDPSQASSAPPNLRLRSRMMAALNTEDPSRDNMIPIGSQPLILTKNRKHAKVPPTANYGVNPMVQTNFVDSSGRVLHDVVSVPIRIPEGRRKENRGTLSSASLIETEEKPVEVKFGELPI